jgi:hypothetical protein
MGIGKLLDAEKKSWADPHKLNYDDRLRNRQLTLLTNFGSRLKLCFRIQRMFGYEYQHWWITDDNWIIEFGGGNVLDCSAIVHCNPRTDYQIKDEFERTREVMQRMRAVCGTTDYSLALRNCEHMARYIQCGAWICFQMVGNGPLERCFFNKFPDELKPDEMSREPLYPGAPTNANTIRFRKTEDALTKSDGKAYTVVVLGPTGCGKSHLINNAFNRNVCEAAASAHSVNREVKFYQGEYSWANIEGAYVRSVNIIDTIGIYFSF